VDAISAASRNTTQDSNAGKEMAQENGGATVWELKKKTKGAN